MLKRITALFLTLCITLPLFTAFAAFAPRLEAPEDDNEYYYSDLNIFYKIGYGMPNCTAYAYGRAYEILGTAPKLSTGSAFRWYGYNITAEAYPYGDEPMLGAIACWGGNTANPNGHVAVIEKIDDGYVYLSNSSWGGYLFRVDTRKLDAWDTCYKVGGEYLPFEGFIYIYNETDADKYTYVEDESGVVLMHFTRYETEVTVPSVIEEKSVVGMAEGVFQSNPSLTTLVIPETVVRIGEKAFADCENLTNVTIPESVTEIAADAFENSENVIVHCKKGSFAHTFCLENGISYDLGILYGDANGDGTINVFDLIRLAKRITDSTVEVDVDAADANADDTINVFDLIRLAKNIAQNEEESVE